MRLKLSFASFFSWREAGKPAARFFSWREAGKPAAR
jgi:hypothetical protein